MLYRRLIGHWEEPERLVIASKQYRGIVWDKSVADVVPDFTERMQHLDTLTYLPDDILTKVD
jgi:asparagine synthase (glutamine-hydrolysing)